jgi:hypothetical protein
MKPVLRICNLLISVSCVLLLAQPTPQQIQQRQMAVERELQREQEQREQQQRDAQMEKMRDIDRQQAEDARRQAEKARAQAIATQENQYLLQQAEQAQAQTKAKAAADDQGTPRPAVRPGQTEQPTAPPQASQPASQPAAPAAAPHWSFRNMSALDKAGLAALGVLLVVLAYAAGIIPARLAPKWGENDSRKTR